MEEEKEEEKEEEEEWEKAKGEQGRTGWACGGEQ